VSTIVHQQSQTFGAHPHADAPDHEHHHDAGGNTVFGFWIYLMSDCLLFASLFAGYAVLSRKPGGANCRIIACTKAGGRSLANL